MLELLLELSPLLWLGLAVALAIAEAATFQLVAIWFALGSVGAGIVSLMGKSFTVQFIVFFIISIISLIATRPFITKILKIKSVKTNADSIIGTVGVVVEMIDNVSATGRVHINGLDWTARSDDGEIIEADERVLIKSIQGVKVIVERV